MRSAKATTRRAVARLNHVSIGRDEKRPLIRDLSFTLYPGDIVAIIGPNGCGKTTLLLTLLGQLAPLAGSLSLDEQPFETLDLRQRARQIGYVPQHQPATGALNVLDSVAHARYAHFHVVTRPRPSDYQIAADLLARLGLAQWAATSMADLSGGERQKVLIACAMAKEANLLLLDEALTHLDDQHSQQIEAQLAKLARNGLAIVMVTHDRQRARRLAGRVFEIADQRAILHVSPTPALPTDDATDATDAASALLEKKATTTRRQKQRLIAVFAALTILAIIAPFIGYDIIGPGEILASSWIGRIFWHLRVPRVIWGLLCGATLAGAGAALQSLFRNDLATPYTLGLASSASLGAALVIVVFTSATFLLPLAALATSGLALAVVLALASRMRRNDSSGHILSGISVAIFTSALGLVIASFASPQAARQIISWQLGTLEIVGWQQLLMASIALPALYALTRRGTELNLMDLGPAMAKSHGIDVERLTAKVVVAATIATSAVVAFTGPIAFVGLIVPHIARLLFGRDNRYIVWASIVLGAIAVVVADMIARSLVAGAGLQVGVVTALVGAPMLMALMSRRRKGR